MDNLVPISEDRYIRVARPDGKSLTTGTDDGNSRVSVPTLACELSLKLLPFPSLHLPTLHFTHPLSAPSGDVLMGLTWPNLILSGGWDHYRQFPARILCATNLRVDSPCNIGAPNSAVLPIWLALFKFGQAMN
jgi:hypothetical protein